MGVGVDVVVAVAVGVGVIVGMGVFVGSAVGDGTGVAVGALRSTMGGISADACTVTNRKRRANQINRFIITPSQSANRFLRVRSD